MDKHKACLKQLKEKTMSKSEEMAAILDAATQLAQGVIPERYHRTIPDLAKRQVWDASQEAYIWVETPSEHIDAMCRWLRENARAKAREARITKFNPSRITAKLGAREAAKEESGVFAWGATGYAPDAKPKMSDNQELLAALYELSSKLKDMEKS